MIFNVFCVVIGLITIFSLLNRDSLKPVSPNISLFVAVAAVCFIYFAPYGFDRMQYKIMFLHPNIWSGKDSGWEIWNSIMRIITNYNSDLFFFINDVIYTTFFLAFSFYFFKPKYRVYFIILLIISIGYYSGGTNIMRNGLAISIIFFALRFYKKPLIFLFLCVVACYIHLSVGLVCAGLIIGYYLPKIKLYFLLWLACAVLSYSNSLGGILQNALDFMGEGAQRLSEYTSGKGVEAELYLNAGWRLDFIIYSAIPLAFIYFYKAKVHVQDRLYDCFCSAYLLVNSFWLCVIHMPFTDRIALLSWVLIPIITLFPVLRDSTVPKRNIVTACAFFPPVALDLFYLIR